MWSVFLRILKFPNTLNADDTRKAISIAFTKWSGVSPLTFTEVIDSNTTVDISIGRRSYKQLRQKMHILYKCVYTFACQVSTPLTTRIVGGHHSTRALMA